MGLVTQFGLPAAMPPAGVVEAFSPEAAETLRRFEQLEAGLPAHPSAEQLNEIDALRHEAYLLLCLPDVDANRARLRKRRHDAIAKLLDQTDGLWQVEEADRAFDRWRGSLCQFTSTPLSVLSFKSGGGSVRHVNGREALKALREVVSR